MAWFMTPFGPQSVTSPSTIAEFLRRDYLELTDQQARDYFAGIAEIPDVSFITGQELPAAMAAAAADDDSPFAVAQRAAFGRTDPALASVRRALDAGQSFAIGCSGDSTGDDDGSGSLSALLAAGGVRWFERFVRKVAAAYPSYHVLSKRWNDTTQDFDPWVVLQAQAAGRRYANFTTRSMRWRPWDGSTPAFSSGNLDLRVLVQPDSWTPAAERMLLSRHTGAGTFGTEFGWRWRLATDGTMKISWSSNGTGYSSDKVSTAPVPGVNGTPLWLRVTAEIDPATGWTVKFFTSAATDGVTWTQLGASVAFSGATGALFASTAYIHAGGEGWQPTAFGLQGRIYEVQVRDGVNGPLIVPANIERWERYPESTTTFGGAPTLYVLNGSRSSSKMSYHTDTVRLPKMTPDYGQLVQFFSDGHNEVGSIGPDWIPPYRSWVSSVLARLPQAKAVAVGQNPHTSAWANEAAYGQEHVTRIRQLQAEAARSGWGYLNAYQALLDDPRGVAALLTADGLHPECPTGMEVWATAAAKMLDLAA